MSRQIGDLDPVDLAELDLNDLLALEDVSEPKTKKLKLSELAVILQSVQTKIGDLYFNTDDPTNPSETLGFGTWELYSKGRMLLGADPDNPKYANSGITGGAESVAITEAQMARHRHTGTTNAAGNHTHSYSIVRNTQTTHYGDYARVAWEGYREEGRTTSTAGNHTHGFTTAYSGNNQAHENMSPFITVYIWKRTG